MLRVFINFSPFMNILRCNNFELNKPGFVGPAVVAVAEATGGVTAGTIISADCCPRLIDASEAESPVFPDAAEAATAGSPADVWLTLAVEIPEPSPALAVE